MPYHISRGLSPPWMLQKPLTLTPQTAVGFFCVLSRPHSLGFVTIFSFSPLSPCCTCTLFLPHVCCHHLNATLHFYPLLSPVSIHWPLRAIKLWHVPPLSGPVWRRSWPADKYHSQQQQQTGKVWWSTFIFMPLFFRTSTYWVTEIIFDIITAVATWTCLTFTPSCCLLI